METCGNRGRLTTKTTSANGVELKIYQCSEFTRCTPEDVGAKDVDGNPIQVCSESCPAYSAVKIAAVDVVITSHNYGHFLGEALDSLEGQRGLGQVVVIDDASDPDDQTRSICEARGVRYIRVEHRSVYLARKTGMEATSSPFVVFLDADDKLGPNYLLDCLRVMQADSAIGVVTSDLTMFGDLTGTKSYRESNIEQKNWIHAGSMVRRSALDACQAFSKPAPANSHADWYVWRTVIRAGWKARKSDAATYLYRQHSDSMMRSERSRAYYDLAKLDTEPITLVIPLSGRSQYWGRLRDWIDAQARVTDILMIDTSGDPEFRATVREWLGSREVASTKYVSLPSSEGLADNDRRNQPKTYRAVQLAMPQIYRHMRDSVTTEYMIVIEDDVLPPADAVDRLLRSMDSKVAAVSGLVPSRWHANQAIAWGSGTQTAPHLPMSQNTGKVESVGGTGFGCLLLRRSAMLSASPFNAGGGGNYDVEFSREITGSGWLWLLDWSIACDHAGIVPGKPESNPKKAKKTPVKFMACENLGDVIRLDKCEVCGSAAGPKGVEVPVRACKVHGECSAARHRQMNRDQPHICNVGCGDFIPLVTNVAKLSQPLGERVPIHAAVSEAGSR